jgi:hypothetical protein
MQAFFFGAEGRRLYGAFHEPAADVPAGASAEPALPAVLVCGPAGQEGVRAHRLLRVLADRLSRLGLPVLRFDPYGTGDAQGDDEALDLPGWMADAVSAAGELQRRAPGRRQVWVGFRLGATVACRAAGRSAARPHRLVLCEPVVDGAAHLAALALATVETLEASHSIRRRAWRDWLREQPERLEREAVGFALGEPLHRQLHGLRPAHVVPPPACDALALVPPAVSADAALVAWADLHRVPLEAVDYAFDWTAEEALNTAIVPHGLLQRLCAVVAGQASADERSLPWGPGAELSHA